MEIVVMVAVLLGMTAVHVVGVVTRHFAVKRAAKAAYWEGFRRGVLAHTTQLKIAKANRDLRRVSTS